MKSFLFNIVGLAFVLSVLVGCGLAGKDVRITSPTNGQNMTTSFSVQLEDNDFADTTITIDRWQTIQGLQCTSGTNTYAQCIYNNGFGGGGFNQSNFIIITATRGDKRDTVVVTFGAVQNQPQQQAPQFPPR